MIATKLPPLKLLLPPGKSRSSGVHVSAIIRCIAAETGILKPEWVDELSLVDVREITDPTAILRMSIGLAWEDYYFNNFLGPIMGVAHQPGETHVDGIYMTHDGESLDIILSEYCKETSPRLQLLVHEIKATYKSIKTVGDLTSQWMWTCQCKAYCKALKTRFARLHILYMCGDYSYPIRPVLEIWQIEFSEDEIEDNWELLTTYKREFEAKANG
jgi:hypothetical protein